MLVREAEGVADLVDRGVDAPDVTRVEVHGAVGLGDTENVAADVGPVASIALERNSDLGIVRRRDLFEVEADSDAVPGSEAVAGLALVR